jgi:hypothetical protein
MYQLRARDVEVDRNLHLHAERPWPRGLSIARCPRLRQTCPSRAIHPAMARHQNASAA